jgi:hypothetical protein
VEFGRRLSKLHQITALYLSKLEFYRVIRKKFSTLEAEKKPVCSD